MPEHFFHGVGAVMHGEGVHDCGTGFVEADNLDVGAGFAEFEHGLVDGVDASEVPDMGAADVDGDAVQRFGKIKGVEEIFGGRKENLAFDTVTAMPALVRK